MILKRLDAFNLNSALSQEGLKVKHISGENYLKLLELKKTLRLAVQNLMETEKQVVEDMDGEKVIDVNKKLRLIQDPFSVELPDLKLSESEFKDFVKEQDLNTASVISEFLL